MIISAENLSFSYGTRQVLDGINLSVNRGEAVCLMGPNGCGKTTLLDCILGINRVRKGEVRINGKSIREMKPAEIARHISYVPQSHSPTFPYSVSDVVLMGRTAYTSLLREPSDEDREICREAMEKVGILPFAGRPYNALSGGEIKLVLLARALCQRSDIIVLDEPTASLDFRNELVFLQVLTRLIREEGVTVLMATHSINQLFFLESNGCAVRTVMLSGGRIMLEGAPSDVITEKTLNEIYGINAAIGETENGNGEKIRSVSLLGTDRS